MEKFDKLYGELLQISKELNLYYDVDKVKPYSVYVWSKEAEEFDNENIFDINCDGLTIWDKTHVVIKEAKPIIKKIQDKLKEISKVNLAD